MQRGTVTSLHLQVAGTGGGTGTGRGTLATGAVIQWGNPSRPYRVVKAAATVDGVPCALLVPVRVRAGDPPLCAVPLAELAGPGPGPESGLGATAPGQTPRDGRGERGNPREGREGAVQARREGVGVRPPAWTDYEGSYGTGNRNRTREDAGVTPFAAALIVAMTWALAASCIS